MDELKKRKTPRYQSFDYDSSGVYFITICTQKKTMYPVPTMRLRAKKPTLCRFFAICETKNPTLCAKTANPPSLGAYVKKVTEKFFYY